MKHAEVKVPVAKSNCDADYLVISDPGIGGQVKFTIGDKEVIVTGGAALNALNVVQISQQTRSMSFDNLPV